MPLIENIIFKLQRLRQELSHQLSSGMVEDMIMYKTIVSKIEMIDYFIDMLKEVMSGDEEET